MRKIRFVVIALGLLLSSVACTTTTPVSVGVGLPHASIGINLPGYPHLVAVPGYPAYYAPQLEANFFFYDGMYWVYENDNWYTSSWYNGPWWHVRPEIVPVVILQIPVRYYRRPPAYFHQWRADAPPRWGDHWGREWEQRRSGWDRRDRGAAPPPAPLPIYQRQYSGERYPRQVEQQRELRERNYRYQPREPVVRQYYQEEGRKRAPGQQERQYRDDQHGGDRQGDDRDYRRDDR